MTMRRSSAPSIPASDYEQAPAPQGSPGTVPVSSRASSRLPRVSDVTPAGLFLAKQLGQSKSRWERDDDIDKEEHSRVKVGA